jgi:hypothetical protein
MKLSFPLTPPVAVITASKKGGTGKTHLMLTVADMLTLNGYPYTVFQADDKRRLSAMIGSKVIDLRPNPDLIMSEPTLLRTSFTPFYTACRAVSATGKSVLLDIGADEVENASNFLNEVEIDEDLIKWKLPLIVFVLVQPDIDGIESAVETIRRFREAVPSAHLVLVENPLGKSLLNLLPPSSVAGQVFKTQLEPLLGGVTRIVMPAIAPVFWEPFESSALRFLRVLAMDAEEGSKKLKMEVGDVKMARSAVTVYFRSMHRALSQLFQLPKGGA